MGVDVQVRAGVADILRPQSVAIVGASDRGLFFRAIFDNLQAAAFQRPVFLINPRREQVWGQNCYSDFARLPAPVDHAVILVHSDEVANVLADGARHGLKSAHVFASGIGDGEEALSARRASDLRAVIAEHGLRVCGPNTLGSVSIRERALLYPDAGLREVRAGSIGAIFQSGGILQFWMKTMAERGGEFSYGIASGNELDCDLSDYLEFLIADAHTRVIVLFIEGIRRPTAFHASCVRALEAGKPIVAMKLGRSERGKAQALSHTGALAADDKVFDAFCRRYGITRCSSLDEMVEVTLAFQAGRLPSGERAGIVVHSGGMKGLILDEADAQGLAFANLSPETIARLAASLSPDIKIENPLDASVAAALSAKGHAGISIAVAQDPQVDILAINAVLPRGRSRGDAASFRSVFESTDKPVLGIARMDYHRAEQALDYQSEIGFPVLQGIPESLRAIRALIEYADRKRRPLPSARSAGAGCLNDGSIADLLDKEFGILSPRGGFAENGKAAAGLADGLGYPVALKLISPDIIHKTELGAVATGLRSANDVMRSADAMLARARDRLPRADMMSFQVQKMVEGVELIVGARADASFGPYLLIGLGGVFVELIDKTQLVCLPLDVVELDRVLASPPLASLLAGYRGKPPADVAALRRTILGVADFYLSHQAELEDFEINPLIVGKAGEGVAAVDIRLLRKTS
jgi:acetate---CoA ligase (ADP-forming)